MKRTVSLCVLWLASVCMTCESPIVIARSLLKAMTIAGRIINEETQLPLSAELFITVEGFNPVEAMTDSTGNFSVTIPEATHCQITVKAKGFDSKEETFLVSESASNYFEIRLTPIIKLTMSGTVFGGMENNEQPLDAKLTVYVNSDFIKEDSATIVSGKYSESFTNFGWYIIDFSAPGYADVTDTIWVMNNHRENIHKDYHLIPLDSKLTIPLTDIHFKFGSSTIEPEVYTELNYLSDFLIHNLSKQIEITGHTDATGPMKCNLLLSRARVQSIVNYLTIKGVKSNQLITRSYGEDRPIDSNATFTGKANNRRVELVLSDKPVMPETSTSILGTVHFDFEKATLTPNSNAELNQMINFFTDNPLARVEIAGHTDSSGPEEYNNFLSKARTQAVVNYLKSKGVNGDQLLARSYGKAKPIGTNTTATGKANNRRVELIVLSK